MGRSSHWYWVVSCGGDCDKDEEMTYSKDLGEVKASTNNLKDKWMGRNND